MYAVVPRSLQSRLQESGMARGAVQALAAAQVLASLGFRAIAGLRIRQRCSPGQALPKPGLAGGLSMGRCP
jgi:hypothetical protein